MIDLNHGVQSEYTMENGVFTRRDTQDAQGIIDQNAVERNSGVNDSRKSEFRKVASIPLVMVEYLKTRPMSEGGPIDLALVNSDVEHKLRFARFLNDSANEKLRTNNSRI